MRSVIQAPIQAPIQAVIGPVCGSEPSPRVTVVVVTYNSGDDVLHCVSSVFHHTDIDVSVTVVDNASTDGIPSEIERRFPTAQVIRLSHNRGFANAVNVGIRSSKTPFVLVLNPDTIVAPNTIRTLLDFADAHPAAGVVAPLLVYPDGRNQLTARSFPTAAAGLWGRRSPLTKAFPNNPWSARFLTGRHASSSSPAFRTDWVSGACMLVPRGAVDVVGLLDERYFLFWEDADWCKRMDVHGFEVWTVPSAVVTHHEGGSRRGWPSPVIKSFHRGAYLYWRTHIAPQWWNPLRWLGAGALASRRWSLTIVGGLTRLASREPHARSGSTAGVQTVPNGGPVVRGVVAGVTPDRRPLPSFTQEKRR